MRLIENLEIIRRERETRSKRLVLYIISLN